MNEKGFIASALLYGMLALFLVIMTSTLYVLGNNKLSMDKLKSKALSEIQECRVNNIWSFSYTGNAQEFTVPCEGNYKIEAWGAQGGSGGGLGGYTSGEITLEADKTLYVYVGGKGNDANKSTAGGYNGGGNSTMANNNKSGATGGGATDIRLRNGNYDDFDSLKSRIMVAAGGGGGGSDTPGHAGGLTGYTPVSNSYQEYMGKGAQQNSGGAVPSTHTCATSSATAGTFGQGGTGGASQNDTTTGGGSGGGGGYYGGSGAGGLCNGSFAGGGGSSFISGHSGCNAINESSTKTAISHSGQSIHYSGNAFANTIIIDGKGCSWTTTQGSCANQPQPNGQATGHGGHGYARITLISVS